MIGGLDVVSATEDRDGVRNRKVVKWVRADEVREPESEREIERKRERG